MKKLYLTVKSVSLLFLLSFTFATASAQIDIPIGTGTTGNANTTYPCPLQDFYEGSRMQYLYKASELNAAGMNAGTINAIKFNVLALATSTFTFFAIEQFTIKIGTTTTTSLSVSSWEPVTATVYGPVNYTAVLGINTFAFNTPFFWNGSDNIVIEICGGDPNNTSDVFYTGNPVVPWTTGLSFNGSHSYRADNLGNLCGTTTTSNTGNQTDRPNIIFNWTNAQPCTSPPVPGSATASPNAVCGGTPVNLTVTGASFGSGQTYQWESSTNIAGPYAPINTSSPSPFYTVNAPLVTTYYRIAVTCSGNTQYSVPAQVAVNSSTPVPTITSNPTGNVCSGTTVNLSTPTCLGCTYSWSNGGATNAIDVTQAGLYTVTVSNSCGTAAVSKEVIVNPSPSLSISSPTGVCLGSSVQMEANGAASYTWSPATGLNTTTGATVTASPTTTTTYTVTGTLGGCSKTLSVTITVNTVPTAPAVTASGTTTFCNGGSVTLTSSAAAGNQWYKDNVIISGSTAQTYSATTGGNYTVKTTVNNCTSNASTGTAVTVNAIPTTPTITQAGNALQSSASSGNQWFLNGTAVPGATSATYTPSASGQYTVQSTVNGCTSNASAAFSYTVTATSDPVLDKKITIAPNPVSDDLLIKYNGTGAKFNVTLVNINGVILKRGSFTSNYHLDMRKYSAGLYIVRIMNERNGERVQRIIVKQ